MDTPTVPKCTAQNENYLLRRVLLEFHKYDKFKRGMVTAAAFSKVIDGLGGEVGDTLFCVLHGEFHTVVLKGVGDISAPL